MTKFNVLLLLAVIASALLMVSTAYDARRLFTDLHRADLEALRLQGEQKRLEAERQLQATNLRVERTAREKLRMVSATPAVTMYEGRAAVAPVLPTAAAAVTTAPALRVKP
ncbi:MAG: cell division protein FtsL [Microbacteriaceae bacterium]|nr:cell division protein FtsL [Burkholderiaceae bacterium]